MTRRSPRAALTKVIAAFQQHVDEKGDKQVSLSTILQLLKGLDHIFDDVEEERGKVVVAESVETPQEAERKGEVYEPDKDPSLEARIKAQMDDWLGQREYSRQWDLENFRQILQLGQAALRNTALINGGAAVALLAFAGHILESGGDAGPFATAMMVFGAGVFASVLAMATSYVSQLLYGGQKAWHISCAKVFHGATLIIGLVALGFFLGGVKMGYEGLSGDVGITVSSDRFKKNAPPPKRAPAEPPSAPTDSQPKKPPPKK